MLYLRHCHKCKGYMFLDKDHYGVLLVCLQCGLYQDHDARPDVVESAANMNLRAKVGLREVA